MQIIKSLAKVFVFICPVFATAQSTYLPEGNKIYQMVDRMEIKYQRSTGENYSTIKPYSRKNIVAEADSINKSNPHLSKVDKYNLNSIYMNNSEWYTGDQKGFASRRPILKTFYKTKTDLINANIKDFYLSVNPVLAFQFAKEQNNNLTLFLNTRGVTARGMISKKIGFSTTVTDNQERGPSFFEARVDSLKAVPGYGFYKPYKNTGGVDYLDARGYITLNAAKYIDVQFGYDKNFIGDGYRSLFLSDGGNSNLFLKLNTKIWKFNYQNLFMELMPQFTKNGDKLLDRKYAAMHHLSINITKGINVGFFEGIVFGRKNSYELQYLNPIIFLRHLEGTVGSPDNALAGFNFKANALHHIQLYGQLLLDEFKIDQIRANNGWWANKWGLQLGAKYIDAFGISNLDIQVETNRVRPFTYSHGDDSVSNYTHYNQPLAHPLGANFQEFIGIVKYQPIPKLYITARAIFYTQGLDSLQNSNGNTFDAGGDVFRTNGDVYRGDNYTFNRDGNGYTLGIGRKATCLNGILKISYEFKENLFFDFTCQYRTYKLDNVTTKSTIIGAGLRLNIFQREYDY